MQRGFPIDHRLRFTVRLSTGIVSTIATDWSAAGYVSEQVVDADVRIYVQEVRAVHTGAGDGGMRVAVRLPGMRYACPRVLLTAPGCLTMSADARKAGAKYERSTDGLHDPPPYLRDPAGWTKKLKRARKLKRAQARASRPA